MSTGGRPGSTAAVRMHVVLLAALPLEVRPFLRQSRARPLPGRGLPAWEFQVGEGRGGLALTGMGEEAARESARQVLELWQPEIIVSLGFGGALLPGLAPGQLVLGASFGHYDPQTGRLLKVEGPAPPRPLLELSESLESAGLPADIGCFVSTPGIIHKERQGRPLRGLTQPVLDLESAAVAAVAAAAGISFLALRVITDSAGEEIPDFLRKDWKPGYGPGLPKALGWLARDPRRLGPMLHLWRRSRLAARQLSQALQVLLPLI
ncbi:MAG: phosphorylase family protein [Desulfobaccales bacterium]